MADNRSAAWHYRAAENEIERGNFDLAQAHAALAHVGASLMRSVQSPERADLLDCVSGRAKE